MRGAADGFAVGGWMGVRRVGSDGDMDGDRRGVAIGFAQQAGGGEARIGDLFQMTAEGFAEADLGLVSAAFISRPVSSAAPKRPSGRTASTSSLVCPAMAISKSWMAAAPFSAKAVA